MQSDLANNYPSWRRDLAATLEAEGIEPVLYEGDYWGISQRAPFVFRKTQTQ